jgi:homocysteine S-methyltransferase
MNRFLEEVQQKPLLGDGAMGTLLYTQGVAMDQCLELLAVEQPATIAAIHAAYLAAGADYITTHTFGTNALRLAHHGLQGRVRELNRAAVQLAHTARDASGRAPFIAGNVGPVGKRVVWEDATERAEVEGALQEQIEALVEASVDFLILETFGDGAEAEVAVRIAKRVSDLPVVACVGFGKDGLSLVGERPQEVAVRLVEAGADGVGANCSVGPAQMVATMGAMRQAVPQTPLCATPNAGIPTVSEAGALLFPLGAREFAAYVPALVAAGATLVGGCCGTTPEYSAAMREKL